MSPFAEMIKYSIECPCFGFILCQNPGAVTSMYLFRARIKVHTALIASLIFQLLIPLEFFQCLLSFFLRCLQMHLQQPDLRMHRHGQTPLSVFLNHGKAFCTRDFPKSFDRSELILPIRRSRPVAILSKLDIIEER